MNEEVKELCNEIKNKLIELGCTEFTLYTNDYCGDLDPDIIAEQGIDVCADSISLYVKEVYTYAEEMEYVTYVRKIKLINGILFFNLEERERFLKADILNSFEETIDNILIHGDEDLIKSCLFFISDCMDEDGWVILNTRNNQELASDGDCEK